jgi:thymidylate kinase
MALAWHYLATAQDRYRRYRVGEKWALGGSLVIYDRFPLSTIDPQIDSTLMDGAQIAPLAARKRGGLLHSLSRKEAAIYQQMRPPDHLIVLNVSPELSLQRKPDHVREALEAKQKAIYKLSAVAGSKSQKPVIYVNADAPLEEVTAWLKRETWKLI